MNAALLPFADFYRQTYSFEQIHRSAGTLDLVRVPQRQPGTFIEEPVAGLSLQISLRPAPGKARLDLGAGWFDAPLDRPNFVVSPAGQPCHYDIPQALDLLIVAFPLDHFAGLERDRPTLEPLHDSIRTDPLVINLARRLWDLSDKDMSRLEADSFGLMLAHLLLRAARQEGLLNETQIKGCLAPWQVKRATDYLLAKLDEDITLADLASSIGLSPFYFARAFKRSTGIPPQRFLMERRVERARELLAGSQMDLAEIALACGFAGQSHFTTAFKRHMGVTPGAWRTTARS